MADAFNNIVPTIQDDNSMKTITVGTMFDGKFVSAPISPTQCVFAGVGQNQILERMIGTDQEESLELLTRAVNNRTRQMNYFRLYSDLLAGSITEDEFAHTLNENEDDYVLTEIEKPDIDKLKKALFLSRNIKEVNNSEDISMLFSFDSAETDRISKLLEADGDVH